MSGKRIVTVDRLTLRLPRHALGSRDAILREVTRVLSAQTVTTAEHVSVTPAPSVPGEGAQALAHRVGVATAARLRQGGGS